MVIDQINNTHARVQITPQCIQGMGMVDSIELEYCQLGADNCVREPPFVGLCKQAGGFMFTNFCSTSI